MSIRQLRKYLALPPGLALPCYRYGRNRLVVRRSEFDTWFSRYRKRGKSVLARALRDLGLDSPGVPNTEGTYGHLVPERHERRVDLGGIFVGKT